MFATTSIGRVIGRLVLRSWHAAADRTAGLDAPALAALRAETAELQTLLSDVRHRVEARLTPSRWTVDRIEGPGGTDWAWRPPAWCGPVVPFGTATVPARTPLAEGLTLFHDAERPELSVRQIRNAREHDTAPHGVRLDVLGFDGTFVSLVIDLPPEATAELLQRHILRVTLSLETERPLPVFARLNIAHGPNTETILREIPDPQGRVVVDFDLAYTDMNERRVESAWLDLIFEGAEMNLITVGDVTVCRYPRAEI